MATAREWACGAIAALVVVPAVFAQSTRPDTTGARLGVSGYAIEGQALLRAEDFTRIVAPFVGHQKSAADVDRARAYPGEQLLVDARVEGRLGGTGHTVDWDLVAPLARERKLTLAGGLTPENVAAAIERVGPWCVDVASGVEVAGEARRKDLGKVQAFVQAVRGGK